jgi:hypothetical protein
VQQKTRMRRENRQRGRCLQQVIAEEGPSVRGRAEPLLWKSTLRLQAREVGRRTVAREVVGAEEHLLDSR